MDGQLWNQADSFKDFNSGRIWVIGLIGYEVCVFKFDILRYSNRGPYENFNPLVPNECINWDRCDFEFIEAKVEVSPKNPNEITVIKWLLNNKSHHRYIISLLRHICTHDA